MHGLLSRTSAIKKNCVNHVTLIEVLKIHQAFSKRGAPPLPTPFSFSAVLGLLSRISRHQEELLQAHGAFRSCQVFESPYKTYKGMLVAGPPPTPALFQTCLLATSSCQQKRSPYRPFLNRDTDMFASGGALRRILPSLF